MDEHKVALDDDGELKQVIEEEAPKPKGKPHPRWRRTSQISTPLVMAIFLALIAMAGTLVLSLRVNGSLFCHITDGCQQLAPDRSPTPRPTYDPQVQSLLRLIPGTQIDKQTGNVTTVMITETPMVYASHPHCTDLPHSNDRKIMFTLGWDDRISSYAELYVMDEDGTHPCSLIDKGIYIHGGDWSPDERRIVFWSNRQDGYQDLFIMDIDGENIVNLTNEPFTDERDPVWSPDGQRIVFSTYMDIEVINADGSGRQRLIGGTEYENNQPAWSPDGKQIVFRSTKDTEGGEIYVMNADGSHLQRLTHNGTSEFRPLWSPDGRYILFAIGTSSPTRDSGLIELYIMNADGSNPHPINSGAVDPWQHMWSPDSQNVLYSDRNVQLYNMNLATHKIQSLGKVPLDWIVAWR